MSGIIKLPVSIVMPCYNEANIIEQVVRDYYREVVSLIPGSEFIIVDDCSKDNSWEILERLSKEFLGLRVFKNPVNSGHGKSTRMGYELAGKEWVFQVDSDNQFEAKDFWKLYQLKDKADFILGFRKVRHDSLVRLVLTRIIRITNFVLFGVWIKDANIPFRLMKKSRLCLLLAKVNKEALAPNILLSVLAKKSFKLIEVPVEHKARKTGKESLVKWSLIKFALKGLKQLLTARL